MRWYLIFEDNTLDTNFYTAFAGHKEKFGLVLLDAIEDWLKSPELSLARRIRRCIQKFEYTLPARPR